MAPRGHASPPLSLPGLEPQSIEAAEKPARRRAGGLPAILADRVEHYRREWRRVYAAGDPEVSAGDHTQLGRLLQHRPSDELDRLITAYLDDADAYLVERGHPLTLLATRVNRYLAARTGRLPTDTRTARAAAVGPCRVCRDPVGRDDREGFVHVSCAIDPYAFRCRVCGRTHCADEPVIGMPMVHLACWAQDQAAHASPPPPVPS